MRIKFLLVSLAMFMAASVVYAQDEVPAAIQTLKNAGVKVKSLGYGKWSISADGKVRILNDDGSLFRECQTLEFYSEKRIVITTDVKHIPAYTTAHSVHDSFGNYLGTATMVVREEQTKKLGWDIIDYDGNSILKFPVDAAAGFSAGLCAVRIGDLYGFIDLDGNLVCEPKFEKAQRFIEDIGIGIIGDKDANYIGLIDRDYQIILPVGNYFKLAWYFPEEHNGHKGLILYGKDGKAYSYEPFMELYRSNDGNISKAVKEYNKKNGGISY